MRADQQGKTGRKEVAGAGFHLGMPRSASDPHWPRYSRDVGSNLGVAVKGIATQGCVRRDVSCFLVERVPLIGIMVFIHHAGSVRSTASPFLGLCTTEHSQDAGTDIVDGPSSFVAIM